jgi:hypothetical protein
MPVEFYRNNSFVTKFELYLGQEKEIKELRKGYYNVIYCNVFGNIETLKVDLMKNMNKKEILYSDYLDYGKYKIKSELDKMQNGQESRIEYHALGCFNNTRDTIYLRKENESIFIRTTNNNFKKMNPNDITNFKVFEIELNLIKSSQLRSTAYASYEIKNYGEKPILKENICDWYGFSKILDQIFPKEKSENQ